MTHRFRPSPKTTEQVVRFALEEDIGTGDITAGLIPAGQQANAHVITREPGVLCGSHWVDEVFRQVDANCSLEWAAGDGDEVQQGQLLFSVTGPARSLLTAERSALNFLQSLSGTATRCAYYADLVSGTGVRLLDTRKTLPGLREAQKYAVSCGGCYNHRMGLFDAFLIKENHIEACGGIARAVAAARKQASGRLVEVEVETFEELAEAIAAGSDRIMLDNFSVPDLVQAVSINRDAGGPTELEASGNVTDQTLRAIAETGVDYISIGALTKDCKAMDLSMRLG